MSGSKRRFVSFILVCFMAVMNVFAVFPMQVKAGFDYSKYNSLCPITIYPCTSDSTFPSYTTVECTKKAGTIYKTDRCTIIKFYKNSEGKDVCKVKYPVPGGTKTAFAKTSRFIYNKSFTPEKMTAAAKANVSAYAGSSTISGWYIEPGNAVYVLGRSGGNSQVAYQISGGFKVAWVKHYDVKFHANGGSDAPAAQIKTQSVNLTLSGKKPTRTGYTFQNWNTSKDGSGTKYAPGGTYKANNASTLYAQWAINSYKLTVNAADEAMGVASGGGSYNYGKSVTIRAVPSTGHSFLKWSDGNTSAVRSVTVTANASYTASFAADSYNIEVKSADGEMGIVSGGGSYSYGSSATIKANPKKGFHFVRWSDGNTSAERSIKVSSNAVFMAEFAADEYTVTVKSANTEMGTVSGGGVYANLSNITVAASPKNGYKFVKWSDGNTSPVRAVTVTGNVSYTAEFAADSSSCTHTYGSWITDRAATCVVPGIRHRVCSKCRAAQNEVVGLAGHQLSSLWTVQTPATCETEGMQFRKCTVCSTYMETKTIDKLEHDFSEKRILEHPTCDKDGITGIFCVNCGECNNGATEVVPALGHSYPEGWEIETEASCTAEGLKSRVCSVCGDKETEIIEQTEHDFRESRHEPNGMQIGQIIRVCKKCSYSETEFFYDEIHAGVVEVVSDSYAKAGDTITIPVKITDNPGILGFHFTLRYNKDIITPQPVSETTFEDQVIPQYAEAGSLLKGGELNTAVKADAADGSGTNEALNISWYHISEVNEDGVLFKVNFKVNENLDTAISDLIMACDTMVGEDNALIVPTIRDGEVTVVNGAKSELKKGDVYIDTKVDERDSILLAKYLVDRTGVKLSEAQLGAADVYIDGKVNTKDSVRLAQIITGWDFSETETVANAFSLTPDTAIRVGECTAQPGQYVNVPITIENNSGVAGFHLKMDYDKEYITPTAIEGGNIIGNDIVSNLPEDGSGMAATDTLSFQWNEPDNITEDGVLCTVQFKVADSYQDGRPLPIQLSCEENDPICCVSGTNINDVNVIMHSGGINIKAQEALPDYPYKIKQAFVSLDGQEEVSELPLNRDFDVTVEFQKLTEGLVPSKVVLGVYGQEGRLIATEAKTIDIRMLLEGKCRFHVDKTEPEAVSLKIFMWDSDNGMKPVAEYYQLE